MMSDVENVISLVEDAIEIVEKEAFWTIASGLRDAILLLKEQEAVKPKSKVRHGANAQIQHFCGNCNSMLHGKPKFCSECGKAVMWE